MKPDQILREKETDYRWPDAWIFLFGYFLLLIFSCIAINLTSSSLVLILLLVPPVILATFHYPRKVIHAMIFGLMTGIIWLVFRMNINLRIAFETIFVGLASLVTLTELTRLTVVAQQRAEAARRLSEERNRYIVEAASEGIWMGDASFHTTFVNSKMATILGFTPAEMIGRQIYDFIDPRDKVALETMIDIHQLRPHSLQDFSILRKDNSLIWVSAAYSAMFDEKGTFIGALAMVTDINERKKVEEELKISEERFRRLADYAPDLIYRLRVFPTLSFEYINPRITDLCGYSVQEFLNNPALIYMLVHPDDLHLFSELPGIDTGFHEPVIMRWICKDQRVLWTEHHIQPIVNSTGQVELVEGIARDITARKKTEDTLRESEEKFKSLANSITEIFFALDSGLHYIYWNRAVEQFTGLPAEEVLGKTIQQVLPELVQPKIELVYRQALADQKPHISDTNLMFQDQLFSFEVSVYPTKNSLSVFARDITVRKKAEEELRFLSTHDILTGLYNRAYFETELDRLRSSRIQPISVVMADVDDLKIVNDQLGHAAGDDLLREVARALREAFRVEDVVARIGGDEFGVLLPEADEEAVSRAVERVAGGLSVYNSQPGRPFLVVSFGAATARTGGDLTETMKLADAHMYADKLRHRNGQKQKT